MHPPVEHPQGAPEPRGGGQGRAEFLTGPLATLAGLLLAAGIALTVDPPAPAAVTVTAAPAPGPVVEVTPTAPAPPALRSVPTVTPTGPSTGTTLLVPDPAHASGGCGTDGFTPGQVRLDGVNTAAGMTASLLAADVISCDTAALVERATTDGTHLGDQDPAAAWNLPEARPRYRALAALLTATSPAPVGTGWVWPAAAAPGPITAQAWEEVAAAGLHTPGELEAMRDKGLYSGWKVAIDDDGAWTVMTDEQWLVASGNQP